VFFWAYLRSVDLTTENADFLAKYEEFDVPGPGRSTGQEDQPEELTAEEGDESNDHGRSLLGQRCQSDPGSSTCSTAGQYGDAQGGCNATCAYLRGGVHIFGEARARIVSTAVSSG
jgi:hypothetical protein